jgi:hypothetical protein
VNITQKKQKEGKLFTHNNVHPSHCALRSHALPLAFDGIMQKIAFPNFAAKLLPF